MATAAQGNERMGENGINGDARLWKLLRIVGWSLAAVILLLPLVAMLFTDEVNWSPGDFLFAAIVLGGSGLAFELAMRRSNDNAYRTGFLLALAAAFLLVWSNAAVGFVGSGANTANVLYFALLAIPVIGGSVSGFKARGLFLTMLLTAIVQAAITGFVYAADLVQADERIAILAINAIFILLWSASAVLFRQAAEGNASRRGPSIQLVLSGLLMAIGAVLMVAMITVESAPGAVPLIIVLLGAGWFFVALFRSNTAHYE